MKLFLLLLLCSFIPVSNSPAQDTILIFHPTVDNIKTVITLSEGIMFPEEENNIHFLGVCHAGEQYDYSLSQEYLSENADIPFSIRKLTSELDPESIYEKNACSDEFFQLYSSSIGAIFPGGPDIPPALYDEKMLLLTSVSDPKRHYLEVSALFHLLGSFKNSSFIPYMENDKNYVVLGICLGMQSMNVATGGSLIQDIPTELYGINTYEEVLQNPPIMHRNYSFDDPTDEISLTSYHFHQIVFSKKTKITKNLQLEKETKPFVLSSHHQAVDTPGKGLTVAAWSFDGKIPELMLHTEYPAVIGVQFHPEKTDLYIDSEDHFITADYSLNFKDFLDSSGSKYFHYRFWEMIGKLFLNNARK